MQTLHLWDSGCSLILAHACRAGAFADFLRDSSKARQRDNYLHMRDRHDDCFGSGSLGRCGWSPNTNGDAELG